MEEKPALFASPLEVGHLLCRCCCSRTLKGWALLLLLLDLGFCPPREALLLCPGFLPPREALLCSSGFPPLKETGAALMMPRSPAGCSLGFRPPREAGMASMLQRSPACEALLSPPGFCPPGQALRRSLRFLPPREAGAASMMTRSPAGVGWHLSNVGPYVYLRR